MQSISVLEEGAKTRYRILSNSNKRDLPQFCDSVIMETGIAEDSF
jgi:hypothetical protein